MCFLSRFLFWLEFQNSCGNWVCLKTVSYIIEVEALFSLILLVLIIFFFKKYGYGKLETFLNRYKMAHSLPRFIDPEGFYELFTQREKAKRNTHVFYYLEDVGKNELSLLE